MFQGCGNKKIEYRVDGNTPQERYSVEMSRSIDRNEWGRVFEPVKEVTVPALSRTRIIQKLVVGAIGSDGISCQDTYYEFVPANERMGYRVKYDEAVVPDFDILVRDMVRYGGVSEEISQVEACQLIIADSALFASMTDSKYTFERPGYDYDNIGDQGRWCYCKYDKKNDRGTPIMMYCFMSTLRYWYNIHVFSFPEINPSLTIFVDDDFYTQDSNFDAVNKMIREKYGLEMIPADRKMTVKTYKVKE